MKSKDLIDQLTESKDEAYIEDGMLVTAQASFEFEGPDLLVASNKKVFYVRRSELRQLMMWLKQRIR